MSQAPAGPRAPLSEWAEAGSSLQARIMRLGEKDRMTASSLLEDGRRRGLTAKQILLVGALNERAKRAEAAAQTAAPPPPPPPRVSFERLSEMFARALAAGAQPSVALRLPDGSPVELRIAGPSSKLPGSIAVSDGKPMSKGTWYGRLAQDGEWLAGRSVPPARAAEVLGLLRRLAEDPEAVARDYGAATGSCCFCSRPLTDGRSTEVGYGPVCAGKWGLPWGAKPKRGT